jgi:hypothetical protein
MKFIKKLILSMSLLGSSLCAVPPSFEEVYYNWQVRAANAPTVLCNAVIQGDTTTVVSVLAEFPSLINMRIPPLNQSLYEFALSIGNTDMATMLLALHCQLTLGVGVMVKR